MMKPSDLGLPAHRFPSYYPGQIDLITKLVSTSSPYIGLQAQTGVGKTVVTVSAAKAKAKRFLYLTATKALQRQLETSFESEEFFNISGHSSYPCAARGELASDDGDEGFQCNASISTPCLYRSHVRDLQELNFISTNYHHHIQLSLSGDPDRLGSFDYIIMDEAHRIAEIVSSICSIKLKSSLYARYLDGAATMPGQTKLVLEESDIKRWKSWSSEARKVLAPLANQAKKEGNDKRASTLSSLISQLARLSDINSEDWVGQRTSTGVSFTPVRPADFAQQHLFRTGAKVILCSATVTREDILELGIPESDLVFIEAPSSFKPEHRPVIYFPTTPPIKFDHRCSEGETRLIVNQVDRIIEARQGYKGIIPVRSYDKGMDLIRRSRFSSIMLFHKNRDQFRDVVTRFRRSSAPTILVSPTIEEGIDFPDDLCRYIILMKVPFLDSRDPVIARRKQLDSTYTDRQTARTIIQVAGRGMRSEPDYCETFIIDAHWGYFQHKKYFPEYFRKAFTTNYSGIVPEPLEERLFG